MLVGKQISLTQILKADSISKLVRTIGYESFSETIIFYIKDLIDFFNLSRNMNASQIGQTAGLIIEMYPHFKAEDIILCFKNIKMLKYGKLYEGLDGSKILEFLNMYDLERQDEIIKLRIEENKKYVVLQVKDYPKEYVEALVKIGYEIKKENKQHISVGSKETLIRYNELKFEFNEIAKQQNRTDEIEYCGEIINFNQYLLKQ